MNKKVRLIGLTGTNGSGKGEAAVYFKRKDSLISRFPT